MNQQRRFSDQSNILHSQRSRNSISLSKPESSRRQECLEGTNRSGKKESFFKSLKNRLWWSNKSKKEEIKDKVCGQRQGEDDDYQKAFLLDSEMPQMTSTPLTRSASARD